MKKLLKNVTLISTTNQFEPADVLIENDMIMQIGCSLQEEHAYVIEGGGRLLVPGFIDIHSHLREPGGEQKETIQTGTKAAARGGFTTVCAMPNTNPVPDHVATVQALFKKIEDKAVVRVLPYAAITEKLQGEQLVDIDQLAQTNIFAFTDDGVGVQRSGMMYQAMKQAAHCDLPVVAHCEDNSLIFGGAVHLGNVSQRLEIPGIPSVAESVQIARDVLLAEATGCHYHVCHVSTKESVRVIRDAKRAGIHVTAEVTPHHLLLNENDVKENDTHFKMNPPLRSKEDQKALLEGLLDGTIDLIATDHAPHTEEEKSVAMEHAPFGIVGFETAFPLLYSYLVKTHKVTLNQLVDWLTIKPAMAFKLPFGRLETNFLADLTLIDLEKETIINREYLLSKGKNTPFHGWKIQGIPVLTMSEGKIVYEEGSND